MSPVEGGRFHGYQSGDLDRGPLVLLLHGGGSTGLSWALFAKEFRGLSRSCHLFAPDLRGHGLTTTAEDEDLVRSLGERGIGIGRGDGAQSDPPCVGQSMDRLVGDVLALLGAYLGEAEGRPSRKLVIIGHS
jgi:protein phosphatase methylesterase 1